MRPALIPITAPTASAADAAYLPELLPHLPSALAAEICRHRTDPPPQEIRLRIGAHS